MRFAVVTLGSLGDLHPFLAIARALAERGHTVHLLTQAPHQAAVRAEGVGFVPVASAAHHARTLHHPLLWHPLHGFGVLWRHLAVPAIGPTIEALDRLSSPPSQGPLVVLASPLAAGARLASERWPDRIRLLSGYTAPMGLRSIDDPLFLGGWQVPRWVPARARRALWAGLDRWKLDPMARPTLASWRERLGLPAWRGSLFAELLHAPSGGLALYPRWFAPVPAAWQARGVRQLGFPVFESGGPQSPDPRLANFLADPAPYVVAYPGSADHRAQGFASRVLAAARQEGLRTLVLSPVAVPEASLPPHSLRLDAARLADVLPQATAFVHHGGIGSIAQGLAAMRPQLVLASAYDQFENGARLALLGAGRWRRERGSQSSDIRHELSRLIAAPANETPWPPVRPSSPADPNTATADAADLLEHMQDQLALPGLAPDNDRFTVDTVRKANRTLTGYALFFALLPSEADARHLAQTGAQLIKAHAVSGAVTAVDRLHVTLFEVAHFPAGTDVPRAPIEAALAAGADVCSAAIPLAFDTLQTVAGGNQALILQCDEASKVAVTGLRAELATHLRRRGLRPERPAPAHMTLVYGSRPAVPAQALSPIAWRADRLVLILSHRGLTHHQHLGEWRLTN